MAPATGPQAKQSCMGQWAYLSGMAAGSCDVPRASLSTGQLRLLVRHTGWDGHKPPGGYRPEEKEKDAQASRQATWQSVRQFSVGWFRPH